VDGYLVLETDTIVGTCAFRSPPRSGEVEIAYFTLPKFEGRGFATEMARHLIDPNRGGHATWDQGFCVYVPGEKRFQPHLAKTGIRFGW
jgi:hypothetical protein